ncbi:MAG: hypothetical protein U0798_09255 [Gemmataceae bacterium]
MRLGLALISLCFLVLLPGQVCAQVRPIIFDFANSSAFSPRPLFSVDPEYKPRGNTVALDTRLFYGVTAKTIALHDQTGCTFECRLSELNTINTSSSIDLYSLGINTTFDDSESPSSELPISPEEMEYWTDCGFISASNGISTFIGFTVKDVPVQPRNLKSYGYNALSPYDTFIPISVTAQTAASNKIDLKPTAAIAMAFLGLSAIGYKYRRRRPA